MSNSERDANIYDRVSRLSEQVAVSAERERKLSEDVKELQEQVDTLNSVLAKGRGGLLVIVTVGSLMGVLLGAWDKLAKLFTGHP